MKNPNSSAIVKSVLALSSLALGLLTATAVAELEFEVRTPQYFAAYTPFPNARAMPFRACARLSMTGKDEQAQARFKCSKATIGWKFNNAKVDIELRRAGRSKSISFNAEEPGSGFGAPQAFETDLNGDGRNDYLIENHQGTQSESSTDYGNMVLALSGPNGYKFVRSITSLLTAKSIVRQAGKVYLLSANTLLASGLDGRTHSYFRFVPLEVRGQRLVINKAIWIQYTKAANHTPARNLSAAEKAATLKTYGIQP